MPSSKLKDEVARILKEEGYISNFKVGEEGTATINIAAAADVGEAQTDVEAAIEGDPMQLSFNAKYLQEALANLNYDQLALEFSGPLSPGVGNARNDASSISRRRATTASWTAIPLLVRRTRMPRPSSGAGTRSTSPFRSRRWTSLLADGWDAWSARATSRSRNSPARARITWMRHCCTVSSLAGEPSAMAMAVTETKTRARRSRSTTTGSGLFGVGERSSVTAMHMMHWGG